MARVRLSVAERRDDLLRAAVGQIEARGVAALRISDVAAVAGVRNALVLYHFETKEKLVAGALERDTMLRWLDEALAHELGLEPAQEPGLGRTELDGP